MTIADIDETDILEYNAFGPWIADVESIADVPRVFRAQAPDVASARMALKIPRDIARRDARPGMDLFDRLLVLDDSQLTVLTRDDDAVSVQSVPLEDVQALEDSVDLLDARLVLHTAAGTLEIPYNGSSRDQVRRLINAVRRTDGAAVATAVPVDQAAVLAGLGQDDVALGSEFLELQRAEPQSVLLAAHGRRILAPPAGAAAAIAHRLRPATLHAAVVFSTPHELHILHRRAQLARGGKPTLSNAHSIVQRAAIRSMSLRPHPSYGEVSEVVIELGSSSITLAVPTDATTASALSRFA